jgi:ubiquinone/menaquinone biosynthesis C-methylase UbiE
MSLVQTVHERRVHRRRVDVLCQWLSELLVEGACVLDVGCGDGLLARQLLDSRPDLSIEGLDVLVRSDTAIPVTEFDGDRIPLDDNSVEVVMLVDVLHHTESPIVLLGEAARVARRAVILKDHCRDGFLAGPTLRFMDWVGNASYGVALPYNYLSRAEWQSAFAELGLHIERIERDLRLYPAPADWVFGRSLHFVARLIPGGAK